MFDQTLFCSSSCPSHFIHNEQYSHLSCRSPRVRLRYHYMSEDDPTEKGRYTANGTFRQCNGNLPATVANMRRPGVEYQFRHRPLQVIRSRTSRADNEINAAKHKRLIVIQHHRSFYYPADTARLRNHRSEPTSADLQSAPATF